ncbi:hypothetical protein CLFO_31230 [Clostridium formicaceticum]|uniref:Uncharacterized protein n=1 Tax=Clostridium formicaceticum TaxID=1497 RepID=A0AAC9RNA6_9CLOT|nr:hypothetical protein BJL90_20735 [Clostridium formicaceticum]ARE88717.1 hypothetical protein CLFO_31230 [Clostridium formicaceticum]
MNQKVYMWKKEAFLGCPILHSNSDKGYYKKTAVNLIFKITAVLYFCLLLSILLLHKNFFNIINSVTQSV